MSDGSSSDNDESKTINMSAEITEDKGTTAGSPSKKKRRRKHGKKMAVGLNRHALDKLNNPDGSAPLSDVAFL